MKNEPAFPEHLIGDYNAYRSSEHKGLTKREYFAGLAMQGLTCTLFSKPYKITDKESVESQLARDAVLIADALIKELEK